MSEYTKLVKALLSASTVSTAWEKLMLDAAAAIEGLQSEVGRLKAANDELREAQTYIDHYGDKWLTSAKDVPTSAYNHGYMDGKNEAEQALEPKRGEWIATKYYTWECSVCGKNPTTGMGYVQTRKALYNYCPNCGAKMEVPDGDEKGT